MSLQTPDTLIYEKGLLNSTLLTQSSFLISESDTYAHLLSHVACLFSSSNGPFQGCQMCFLFQKQTADILDWCEQQIACENNLCWYRWEFTSIRRCQICSLRGLNVPVNYHWPCLHQHSVIRTVFTCALWVLKAGISVETASSRHVVLLNIPRNKVIFWAGFVIGQCGGHLPQTYVLHRDARHWYRPIKA